MIEPHSSNFRVITTNLLGVRIYRKFLVIQLFISPNLVKDDEFYGQESIFFCQYNKSMNLDKVMDVSEWT